MTNSIPLSPAVQAVYDAYLADQGEIDFVRADRFALAAALFTAADQVLPELPEPDWGACNEMRCDIELYTDHQRKRAALLAIAAELEAQP